MLASNFVSIREIRVLDFEPEFRRARLALHVHVPRFTPIVRIKEEAIPALTENRRHLASLAKDLWDAKPSSSLHVQSTP